MPTKEDFDNLTQSVATDQAATNKALDNIATDYTNLNARITELEGTVSNAGLSADQEALVFASIQALKEEAAALKAKAEGQSTADESATEQPES